MKFRKTKKEFLITTKVDFSIQIVYVLLKTFLSYRDIWKKRLLVDIKAKDLFSKIRILDVETGL